jgi:ornithine cyclodeaminase
VILVFSSQTGELRAILQDEGFLTDARTAAAGAVAAKLLAPSNVERIGIIGAGTQGRLQLAYLAEVIPTRQAIVWSRSRHRARAYRVEGFEVEVADSVRELAEKCRLIVTATCSHEWVIGMADVVAGTHITAVGADRGGKQELQPELFARARVRAVDSRSQCALFGDSSWALRKGFVQPGDLVELGELITGTKPGRQNDSDISIADLTGVAVEDIQIAKLALRSLTGAQNKDSA